MIAYALLRRTNPGFFTKVASLAEVPYASPTTGPYTGFAKITASGGQALHDFLSGQFAGAGAVDYETAVAVRIGAAAPRIMAPVQTASAPLMEAAVLIHTEPGRAFAVLGDVDALRGIYGAAVVAGSFDVLAIANATTSDGLTHVIGTIGAVDGVLSTQTLLLLNAAGVAQAFEVEGESPAPGTSA